ncbi:hypothetical protein SAMN04488542_1248 [Fontibacillus panacisegetis]|uniref:Uncharacterized protein n=1 Tax=Fontibacillus panacisegetis TaxID=670482 RepID=A0A1G7QXM2_9BACL|nr:hypothetical protein SAMN04488542_1248 [Fontibacillus panacisegetis]
MIKIRTSERLSQKYFLRKINISPLYAHYYPQDIFKKGDLNGRFFQVLRPVFLKFHNLSTELYTLSTNF